MSRVNRRPGRKALYALDFLRDYVTHYDNKTRSAEHRGAMSRSTAYRRIAPFLAHTPPPLAVPHPDRHTSIMLDGFYIAYPSIKAHRHLVGAKTEQSVVLLAIDAVSHVPLHWAIYRRIEDGKAWSLFFRELTMRGFTPTVLVHDGHYGIRQASNQYFPDALHQRCLVHMVRNVHKDIGITPKAPLARQLQSCIYRLVKVATEQDRRQWQRTWDDYLAAFVSAETKGEKHTKAFLGLHTVLCNAYERNELFTFLTQPGIPNNTNAIEAQNRVLREALMRHRGMSLNRREALIAWILLFRSEPDLRVIMEHVKATGIHTF